MRSNKLLILSLFLSALAITGCGGNDNPNPGPNTNPGVVDINSTAEEHTFNKESFDKNGKLTLKLSGFYDHHIYSLDVVYTNNDGLGCAAYVGSTVIGAGNNDLKLNIKANRTNLEKRDVEGRDLINASLDHRYDDSGYNSNFSALCSRLYNSNQGIWFKGSSDGKVTITLDKSFYNLVQYSPEPVDEFKVSFFGHRPVGHICDNDGACLSINSEFDGYYNSNHAFDTYINNGSRQIEGMVDCCYTDSSHQFYFELSSTTNEIRYPETSPFDGESPKFNFTFQNSRGQTITPIREEYTQYASSTFLSKQYRYYINFADLVSYYYSDSNGETQYVTYIKFNGVAKDGTSITTSTAISLHLYQLTEE